MSKLLTVFGATGQQDGSLMTINAGKHFEPMILDTIKYRGKRFTCATAFQNPLDIVDGRMDQDHRPQSQVCSNFLLSKQGET